MDGVRKLLTLALSVSIGVVACAKTPTAPTAPTPPVATCTYSISTTTFNMAGSGGSASFAVNTASGCAWTVVNNSASFVSVSTANSQSGSGTVTFSVPENPGDTRVGTLSVAGQNVVINQAPNDPLFGNWGGNVVKGNGCPATLPASVEWTGTFRRTSGATTELVITILPVGVIGQVIPITFNGSNIQFFVQIDTLYTFNATLASDRRSLTGTFTGGGCSGTWNGTRR